MAQKTQIINYSVEDFLEIP